MNRWNVHIPAHRVGRHEVPETSITAPGELREDGILQAVRWVHADNGVPAWRPYVDESYKLATATVHFDADDVKRRRMAERERKSQARKKLMEH